MSRQRQPLAKAKALGRDVKDPARYRHRTDPLTAPLGEPPKYLSDAAKEEWRELAAEIPWLRRSDRALVGLTATVAAIINKDPDKAPIAYLAEHRRQLCALGGSPADRSKIYAPSEETDDAAAEFIN